MRAPNEATESTYFANLSFDNHGDDSKDSMVDPSSATANSSGNIENHGVEKQRSLKERGMLSGVSVSGNDSPDTNNNAKNLDSFNNVHTSGVLGYGSGNIKPSFSPKKDKKQSQHKDDGSNQGGSFFGDKVGQKFKNLSLSKETIMEQRPSKFFGGNDGNISEKGTRQPKGVLRGVCSNQKIGPQPSRSPDRTEGRRTPRSVRFSHEFENLPPYDSYFHEMKSSIEEFENDPLGFSPERESEKSVETSGQYDPAQETFSSRERDEIDYGSHKDIELFEHSDSDALITDSETVCSTSDTSSVDTLTLLESCDFSSDDGVTPQIVQLPTKQKAVNLILPKTPSSLSESKTFVSFSPLKPRRGSLPKTNPPSWKTSPKVSLKPLSPTRMQQLKLSPPRVQSKTSASERIANQTLPIKPAHASVINSEVPSQISMSQGISEKLLPVSSLSSRSTPGAFSPTLMPTSSPFETSPRPLSPGMPKTPRGVKTPDAVYAKTKSSQSSTSLYGYPISYQNPSGIGEHAIHAREEFTLWANNCLKYSSSGRVVSSLERDLADGVTLIELVKVLVNDQFTYVPKYHTNPTIAIQRIENIKLCLEYLESLGMNLTGIIAEEIAEAGLKAALAICHCLRQRFPFFTGETVPTRRTAEKKEDDTMSQYQSTLMYTPQPIVHNVAPSLTDSTHAPSSSLSSRRTSLSSSLNSTGSLDTSIDMAEEGKFGSNFHILDKEDLAVLSWVSQVVEKSVSDYEGLQNGKVLCHLINKIANYNITDLVIQYSSPLERLKIALQTAEEHLGVFTELTPTDVIMVQRSHLVRDFLCDLWRLYDTKINTIKEQMAKEKEEDKERRHQELLSRYEQEMELCSDLNMERKINKQREEPWNAVSDFQKDNKTESFSHKFRKLKEQMNENMNENRGDINKVYKSSASADITDRWKASPKTGVSLKELEEAQKRSISRRRGSTDSVKEVDSLERRKSPTEDNFKTLFSAATAVGGVPAWKQKGKTLPSNKQLKEMSRVARMTMMARIAAKTGSAFDDEGNDNDDK